MRVIMHTSALLLVVAAFGFEGRSWSSERPLSGPPLELVWSVDGDWSGVAVQDGSPILYATRSNQLVTVNIKDGSLADLGRNVGPRVRVGVNNGQTMIIGFSPWGETVAAYTAQGEPLWSHETTDGIDDVRLIDLDADGTTEVVVGLNGDGGVLVLSAAGRELWSNHSIGNVWHVTAGPMDGTALRILTTSATGRVHVFSVTGEPVTTHKARCYATDLRLGNQPFVAGISDDGSVVATLDPSGWMTSVTQHRAGIGSLVAAEAIPWIGVSTVTGNVYALGASSGAVEGVASDLGRTPELAWATNGDSPLLIAASDGGLRAFRVASSK